MDFFRSCGGRGNCSLLYRDTFYLSSGFPSSARGYWQCRNRDFENVDCPGSNNITFYNSQETMGFFAFLVFWGFFLHINSLCIEGGLPESFARIALYVCFGTWRGRLFGFPYFVFLCSGSSPADS